MYSNRQSSVLEREDTKEQSYSAARSDEGLDNIFNYGNYGRQNTVTKKKYSSPAVNFLRVEGYDTRAEAAQTVTKEEEEVNEDITPSKTTMQFLNMERDAFEEVEANTKEDSDKKYRINTKGKVLIAVYALVVITIFSLIIINAKMLRSLDSTIESKAAQIETLNEENYALSNELEYAKSDEVIMAQAEELGLID